MNLENLNVQELNMLEMEAIDGGRNVNEGECNGGAFDDPYDDSYPWWDGLLWH